MADGIRRSSPRAATAGAPFSLHTPTRAHRGVRQTLSDLQARSGGPAEESVREHIKHCRECQLAKAHTGEARTALWHSPAVMVQLNMDLIGPVTTWRMRQEVELSSSGSSGSWAARVPAMATPARGGMRADLEGRRLISGLSPQVEQGEGGALAGVQERSDMGRARRGGLALISHDVRPAAFCAPQVRGTRSGRYGFAVASRGPAADIRRSKRHFRRYAAQAAAQARSARLRVRRRGSTKRSPRSRQVCCLSILNLRTM